MDKTGKRLLTDEEIDEIRLSGEETRKDVWLIVDILRDRITALDREVEIQKGRYEEANNRASKLETDYGSSMIESDGFQMENRALKQKVEELQTKLDKVHPLAKGLTGIWWPTGEKILELQKQVADQKVLIDQGRKAAKPIIKTYDLLIGPSFDNGDDITSTVFTMTDDLRNFVEVFREQACTEGEKVCPDCPSEDGGAIRDALLCGRVKVLPTNFCPCECHIRTAQGR